MEIAQKLYPGVFDKSIFGPDDYTPIIEYCGEVLEQHDYDGYHGDTRVLLRNNAKFGYLKIGWGSCSGCDALQATQSWAELQELIEEIVASVCWFETRAEALEWFKEHDWAGESSPCLEFAVKAITHLEAV